MRQFEMPDYEVYTGTEDFKGGEQPLIHKFNCGFDLIADWYGVALYGHVGTKDVMYRLYDSNKHDKASAKLAAHEWIAELEGLEKHEAMALLAGAGIHCMMKGRDLK